MDKKKPPISQRLREKYRVNVLNPDNFEELSSFTISWLQIIMVLSMVVVVTFFICIALFAYTPIVGYFQSETGTEWQKSDVKTILARLDSMEREADRYKVYSDNFKAILTGKQPDSLNQEEETEPKESVNEDDLFFVSSTDSILRREYEEERLNLVDGASVIDYGFHFYPPVNGVVADSFDKTREHYAVDVVANKDEAVKATLDGIVIFSDYTVSTGYVLMLQHNNDFISVYKHNSVLLKSVGSFVRAGETIGIVGNSGELTSGRHLHFELWQKGQALNPAEYINF